MEDDHKIPPRTTLKRILIVFIGNYLNITLKDNLKSAEGRCHQ